MIKSRNGNKTMDDTIDLKKLALLLLRYSWVILLAFLICFIITYFVKTPEYSATALMYVSNRSDDTPNSQYSSSNQSNAQALINTCSVIVRSNSALSKIMEELDTIDGVADRVYLSPVTGESYTDARIKKMITLSSVNNTEVMEIKVTCTDVNDAITIANAIVDVVPLVIKDTINSGYATKVDSAYFDESSFSALKIPILVGLVAAVLAAGVIILLSMLDTRIHTKEDIVSVYNIPVIGEIPDITEKNNERYYARYELKPEKK